MVRILSDAAVADVLSVDDLLPVVADAFRKQGRGAVERPHRPHFPVGTGLDSTDPSRALGTGLAMPAYIHGTPYYATKLASVHPGNAARGLSTVNAQLALTGAETGRPVAYMAATRLTNARTGCIGGLAARELAKTPATVGVLGAGAQARWQVRAIDAAIPIERVRIFSPSVSKEACAADLHSELDLDVTAVDTPDAAVSGADVVVTATTSETPVFPAAALADGALVVAVGAYTAAMQELEPEVFDRATRVYADVPEEVADVGDVRAAGVADRLVPFADVFLDEFDAPDADDVVVVESVGTAVLDAAAASHLYDLAVDRGVGVDVDL